MKMAYLIPYGIYNTTTGISTGVGKKLRHQLRCLGELGVDVSQIDIGLSTKNPIAFLKSVFESYHLIKKAMCASEYDVLYCRYFFPYSPYFLLLKKRRCKVVFEAQDIQTKSAKVYLHFGLKKNVQILYLKIMDTLLGKSVSSQADGIVSVTQEITDYYVKRTCNNNSYLTLGNGILVSQHALRIPPKMVTQIDVLVVANVDAYHGIDRFIRGLHEYNAHYANSIKIVLHIVGDGPELPHLKELTAELNLQDSVIFHGFKSGKELDEMFDMCHIAFDGLAGFRKGLTEASSLKGREYCARGMPFIMALKDADFPENWEYTQMVPANETPIDMNTVVDFANRVMADPEHPQKMRAYAEEHLDWIAKMKVLKEFLESL